MTVKAYMKLNTSDTRDRAWNMIKLMETVSLLLRTRKSQSDKIQDYADKMVVSLLKVELLSAADTLDSSEFYGGEYTASQKHIYR